MVEFLGQIRDPIQIGAIALIVFVFMLSWIGLAIRSKVISAISGNAESILTSTGIFFTFLGIFLGLQEFNTDNIQASIPVLLDGLRLAFLSSVFGLGSALLFRALIRPVFTPQAINSEEVGAADLLSELSNINSSTLAVKEAIAGEGDASVATQLVKLRTDFRDFAEKVSKDGADALIIALEEVIKDFNAKINEQFGDNFKQLNEAVSALLDWQKEYKSQVEFLIEAFNEMKTGIINIQENVTAIQQSTSKIPDQMRALESIFDNTDKRMIELHEGLASLSDMREKAGQALPVIEKSMTELTEGINQSINKQLEAFNTGIDNSSRIQNEQMMKFQGVLDSLNIGADNILDSTSKVSKEVEEIIRKFNDQQEEYSRNLRNNLDGAVSSVEDILNKSFGELDEGMKEELQRCLDMMGKNLTAVTRAFVDQYEPFANRLMQQMESMGSRDV